MLNVTKELTALARKLGYTGTAPDTVAKAINAITASVGEGGSEGGGGCDCEEPLVVPVVRVYQDEEDTSKYYYEDFDNWDFDPEDPQDPPRIYLDDFFISDTDPLDDPSIPVCSIILHDPQEVINAFESNRTVILEISIFEGSIKLFPSNFENSSDVTQLIANGILFLYDNNSCNYFFALPDQDGEDPK